MLNENDNKILIAKAQAFIDVQEGLPHAEICEKFISAIEPTTTGKDILNAFYSILIENPGHIKLLDYLEEKYPQEKQTNMIFKISLYFKENKAEVSNYIETYRTEFEEDREILMLELDYLVSRNFMNIARIKEILSKLEALKASEENAV